MRICTIVVLVSSFGLAACNQAPPSSTPQNPAASATPAAGRNAPAGASSLTATGPVPAAAAPAPAFDEVTLPKGTELSLVLDTAVSSEGQRSVVGRSAGRSSAASSAGRRVRPSEPRPEQEQAAPLVVRVPRVL